MLDPSAVVVIVLWGTLLLLRILATGFLILNRNYGPLKAKQIDLIVFSVISECFWFLGALPSLKFWPLAGGWSNCALWQLWFNATFGLFLWGGLLLLRFVRLYLVERGMRWSIWKMNLLLLVFWSPAWILSIIGTAESEKIFGVDPINQVSCVLYNPFLYAMIAYAFCYVIAYVVFLALLRRVKHRALNEYKGNLVSVIALVVCFLIFTALTALDYTAQYVWARCLAFSALQILQNISFWTLLALPLFMTLKDRVGYQNYFYGRDGADESSPNENVTTMASV